MLEQGNLQKIVSLNLNEKAMQLRCGDRVTVELKELGIGTAGNILPYSENFSQWTAKTNTTVTNDDIPSPFGTSDADKLEATASATSNFREQVTSAGSASGVAYRVYVKPGNFDPVFMVRNQTTTTNLIGLTLDRSDGSHSVFTSNIDQYRLEANLVGNGWYEVVIWAFEGVSDSDEIWVYAGWTGVSATAGEYLHVWGAQLIALDFTSNLLPVYPAYEQTDSAAVAQADFIGRVIEWSASETGGFDVTVKEDASAAYDDPAEGDYSGATVDSITVPAQVVAPPTNLSATAIPYGILLKWTNPAAGTFDYIDVYASTSSAWSGATKLGSVRTDTFRHDLESGEVRYYWIRARKNSGDVSDRYPDSDTSTISGTAQADALPVQLTGATLSDVQVDPTNASVNYRINSDGDEYEQEGGGGYSSIATWLLDGSAGDYDCKLTVNSGTSPTGASVGSWLDCGTTRTWTLTQSSVGTSSNNCTIEIRDGTTLEVLASATVTMSSQVVDFS